MMQKDLKIGLILGLVIVTGVVIKLAVDPRLSTEARMLQLNNDTDDSENSDSNNISRSYVRSEISTDFYSANMPEQQNALHSNEVISKNEIQDKTEESVNNSSEETPYFTLHTAGSVTENLSSVQEQAELPEIPDSNQTATKKEVKYHVVLQNQTLSEISRIYYGSPNQWQKIVDANPDQIKNPNKIKLGMKLIIP
ncbi:MAG: LysM peptidoglycan-binding domain-containing protein [Sedimentisphaerales bacterium]|nr:LysM peptidoglycan-binding domain-containing protein [Sedimentisphaerales bacterium]